jgi:hypothetical protein
VLQKKRIGRLRRPLSVEVLEDRTLLSGNVVALLNPFGNGQLTITGDNGNNAYAIHLATILGNPALAVTGSSFANPIAPGNVTAVNSVAGGTVFFPLASIGSIQITQGNGTNTILIGNGGPISLTGNISIVVGSGVDTVAFSNVSTSAGVISFTGTGGSSDNISMSNVVAGAVTITTGNGNATVSQTNVTLGTDTITTGAGNDTINITSSMFHPPPRLYAIGILSVNSGAGNDTINITGIDVGPSTIAAGTGNNNVKFDNSLIQQATITVGAETSGAVGSNTVDVSNDTVTGAFLNVFVLNESGVSGVLQNNTSNNFFFFGGGSGPGSVNTVTMVNVQFTGGGNLNLRVDDGVPYFNAGNNTVLAASTVLMQLVDTSGNINVTLGDFFQSAMLGVGTVGLNDLDANNLNVSIGNFNDIIVITAILQGSENVTIGNVATYPIPPLPTPSVLINGIVGENSANEPGNETIKLGTNTNGKLTSGWPVNVMETVHGNLTITGGDLIALTLSNSNITGNLSIMGTTSSVTTTFPFFPFQPVSTGGNGWTLNISNTTVGGATTIILGNGGPNHTEAITLINVTSTDLTIQVNTVAADAPDFVPGGAYITLINVNVTDTTPNLNNLSIKDIGHGVDTVTLMGVNVVYGLQVLLSDSRMNQLSATNVTAAFGIIDGGPGGSLGSVYFDGGGNFGYLVTDFVGH